MTDLGQAADGPEERDGRGRFAPGRSGNPAGKPPGTRNRATRLRELLNDGEDAKAARVVIDKALSGDPVAARFLCDRLFPKTRGREIDLELPPPEQGGKLEDMFDSVLWRMASGEITPDEAALVVRLLSERRFRFGRSTTEERAAAAPARPSATQAEAVAAVEAVKPRAAANAVRPAVPPTARPNAPSPVFDLQTAGHGGGKRRLDDALRGSTASAALVAGGGARPG